MIIIELQTVLGAHSDSGGYVSCKRVVKVKNKDKI